MASPDMGGTKRANAYAKFLQAEVAVCYKQRKKANVKDYARLNQLTLETWYVAPVHRMFGL